MKTYDVRRPMALVVGRRLLSTEARILSRGCSCVLYKWAKWHWDRFFTEWRILRFSPVVSPLIFFVYRSCCIVQPIVNSAVVQDLLRTYCDCT